MALLDSEVYRIKYELGFNVLGIGAEPYIGIHAVFNQVIQQYMTGGATTTSATVVTAAPALTPVSIVLAAFTQREHVPHARVIIDEEDRQETSLITSVDSLASTITVTLQKAHSGTYPVTVEGGESIIRGILRKLETIGGLNTSSSLLDQAAASAGIRKVDEVEFFGSTRTGMSGRLAEIRALRQYWRGELARACGVYDMWMAMSSSGSSEMVLV